MKMHCESLYKINPSSERDSNLPAHFSTDVLSLHLIDPGVRGLALRLRRFFPGIFASLSVTRKQFGLALCVFKCPCIL